MNYDFDRIITRKGHGDLKYDVVEERWGRDDLLPLWVADMDFETPDFILNALRKQLEHPVLGYSKVPDKLWPTVIQWVKDHHQWDIRREWLCYIPGIVKGIGFVLNCFTQPGDKVIIQPPVYHPFRLVPECNRREVVFNPLIRHEDGHYEMDFDQLEQACDSQCKVLILSNPHNPAGICWPKETLKRLAHFCHSRGILVISDEIHCDMALFGHQHIPFATVSEEARQCSITFQAPTKTFNIAGVVSSYAIVPDDKLRNKFYRWMEASEFEAPNIFAPTATIAAFSQGEEWRKQMLRYIEKNYEFVNDYCLKHMPSVQPLRPQASFLVWLDCRNLNLSHEQLLDLFIDKAHLALNDGEMFGPGGEGFMRLNIASPRSILEQAMRQLAEAIARL
ncbi:MAG: PatB family C-S lyase [Prevotella sp.]|nr:PatB family C-S lyase [Prevotella sp.]